MRCFHQLAFALLLLSPHDAVLAGDNFAFPAPLSELISRPATYDAFARSAWERVEGLLGEPARIDDPATLQRLLALRVHLAHHLADNEHATTTAVWIRSLQAHPAERAMAGLSSLAAVAGRRAHPGLPPDSEEYRRAFQQAFTRLLEGLPYTPDTLAVLRRQHQRAAALDRETILADLRTMAAALGERRDCSLAEADEIVRAFHRLNQLLPLQRETLAALESAIAARSEP